MCVCIKSDHPRFGKKKTKTKKSKRNDVKAPGREKEESVVCNINFSSRAKIFRLGTPGVALLYPSLACFPCCFSFQVKITFTFLTCCRGNTAAAGSTFPRYIQGIMFIYEEHGFSLRKLLK